MIKAIRDPRKLAELIEDMKTPLSHNRDMMDDVITKITFCPNNTATWTENRRKEVEDNLNKIITDLHALAQRVEEIDPDSY